MVFYWYFIGPPIMNYGSYKMVPCGIVQNLNNWPFIEENSCSISHWLAIDKARNKIYEKSLSWLCMYGVELKQSLPTS
jgi:hypothetical protein